MLNLDTITLPDEMNWIDEFAWSRVSAGASRTIGGKLIIEESQTASMAGRPVTLSNDNAWLTYSDAEMLRSWADDLNKTMTLTMHNSAIYQVKFRLWEAPVVQWEPLILNANRSAGDWGILSIKLVMN